MFADKAVSFFNDLEYRGKLPEGISIMNPFRINPEIITVISKFYHRFYSDNHIRYMILGINPGRNGAGVTGIPFTDTLRLSERFGLSVRGFNTFETSSVFMYDMMDKFGGTEKFYSRFYISSVSPLGFTSVSKSGNTINYNYYESKELTEDITEFVVETIYRQLEFGIAREICFCLGTGRNFKFLSGLNSKLNIFGKIIPLEHPRFIMQYRLKQKEEYIARYLQEFSRIG
jgi:hypothetical protein